MSNTDAPIASVPAFGLSEIVTVLTLIGSALTALYGRQRTYRVSTYSARGIESELSLPVIAQPSKAEVSEDLFANGFE